MELEKTAAESPEVSEEFFLSELTEAIRARIGINIGPQKYYVLRARLAKVFREGRYLDLPSLLKGIRADETEAWECLARHVTTTHTYFFREEEHFDFVLQHFLEKGISRPLIWSAACSSGEEPYGLAIRLAEAGFRDFAVLASDINRAVLKRAHDGVFDSLRLQYAGAKQISRWFSRVDETHYRVIPELRRFLAIKCLNIMEELKFEKEFDAVFCKNVMIYFKAPEIRKVLRNVSANLKVGGLLMVGRSEMLSDLPPNLERVGVSVYRKSRV